MWSNKSKLLNRSFEPWVIPFFLRENEPREKRFKLKIYFEETNNWLDRLLESLFILFYLKATLEDIS